VADLANSEGLVATILLLGALSLALWNVDNIVRRAGLDRLMRRMATAAFRPLTDAIADRMQQQIDVSTKRIWDELRPNSGKSLRDAVDRTEQDVKLLRDDLSDHKSDVQAHASDPTAHIRPTDPDDGPAGPR